MATPDRPLKLTELADAAGVTPRTVRYYIAQGLLPSPGRLGPHTRYGPEYLARLRLIRQFQAERLPLTDIRERLAALTDADVLESPATVPLAAVPASFRPLRVEALQPYHPTRTEWERIVLAADVELHVRHPRSASTSRLVDELVRTARDRRRSE